MNPRSLFLATALTTTVALALAACSGGSGDDGADATPSVSTTTAPAKMSAERVNLIGPGCDAYITQVPTGKGSIEGMAVDPVVTAIGHNPMLTKLTAAISGKLNPKVKLAETLGGKEYTIFAPVDTAFAQVPAKRMNKLEKDTDALVATITFHVVTGQLAPAKVLGHQMSVQGGTLTVKGKGNQLTVNGANVICGGIKTANATVYLIDKVLDPTG